MSTPKEQKPNFLELGQAAKGFWRASAKEIESSFSFLEKPEVADEFLLITYKESLKARIQDHQKTRVEIYNLDGLSRLAFGDALVSLKKAFIDQTIFFLNEAGITRKDLYESYLDETNEVDDEPEKG